MSVAQNRSGTVAKAAKLVEHTAGGERAVLVARLAAREARIAAGVSLVSRLDKIATAIDLSTAAKVAVPLILDRLARSEMVIGFFNNILEAATDPEAVIAELLSLAQDTEISEDDLSHIVQALGRELPFEEGSSSPSMVRLAGSAAPLGLSKAPAIPRRLIIVTNRTVRSLGAATKEMSVKGRRTYAKTLASKIRDGFGKRTPRVAEALLGLKPTTKNGDRLLRQLGSASDRVRKGGEATAKVVGDLFGGDSAARDALIKNLGLPADVKLRSVEEVVEIGSWVTKTGKKRIRKYDIVLEDGTGAVHRIELKNWDIYPPGNPHQMASTLDEMARDLVLNFDPASRKVKNLLWVFPELHVGQRSQILAELRKATDGKAFRKRLWDKHKGLSTKQLNDAVADARLAVDECLKFHLLSFKE